MQSWKAEKTTYRLINKFQKNELNKAMDPRPHDQVSVGAGKEAPMVRFFICFLLITEKNSDKRLTKAKTTLFSS